MGRGSWKMPLEPRLDIAREVVAAYLWGDRDSIRVCCMPDGAHKYAGGLEGPIDAIWPDVIKAQNSGHGIFFYVNEIMPGIGSGKGGCAKNVDVASVRALSIDDPKDGLPEDWDWHADPDIVILTSKVEREGRLIQKCQALWRVQYNRDIGKLAYRDAQRRLIAHYGS